MGIIYGDPIKGQMQLLKTVDGGKSWNDISKQLTILLEDGEASFAASGTNIRTLKGGHCWIATGGKRSRVFYSSDYGNSWKAFDCPIIQGENATGPFSLAFWNEKQGIAVGGNYQQDALRNNNLVLTSDGGETWFKPGTNPFGYRSSIEYLTQDILLASGTSGVDISNDGGKNWRNLTIESYHVVRRAKSGKLVLLAGSKGRISKLDW